MSKINQLAARHTEKLNYKVNMGMFDLLVNLDEQLKDGADGRVIVPIKKSIITKILVDSKCDHILKNIDDHCIFATMCLYRDKNNFVYVGSYNLKFNNKPEMYYIKNIEHVKTYNIDMIPFFRVSNTNSNNNKLVVYRNNCISINCKYNTNALSIKNTVNIYINKRFAQYNNLRSYDKSQRQGYNSIKNFNIGNNYIDDSSDEEEGRPNIGDIIKAKEFKADDRYSVYYHTKTFNKGEPITYSSDEDMGRDDIYRVNDDVEKEIRLYEKYLGKVSENHKDKDRRKYLNKLIVAYNNKALSQLEKDNLSKFNKIYKMDDQ